LEVVAASAHAIDLQRVRFANLTKTCLLQVAQESVLERPVPFFSVFLFGLIL